MSRHRGGQVDAQGAEPPSGLLLLRLEKVQRPRGEERLLVLDNLALFSADQCPQSGRDVQAFAVSLGQARVDRLLSAVGEHESLSSLPTASDEPLAVCDVGPRIQPVTEPRESDIHGWAEGGAAACAAWR